MATIQNLVGTNKIKDEWQKINNNFAALNAALEMASTAVNAGYNEDPNTTQKAYIVTNHANSPIGGTFWHIRTFFYSSLTGNRAQIAIRYNGPPNQMFIRYHYNGEWSSWTEIATSERGFFNTDLVLPNGKGLYVRDTNGNVKAVGAINNSNIVLLGEADLPVVIRGTTVQFNGNTAWHAGNSGPFYRGSGSPEGVVTAPPGSIYQNTSGGTNTTLYVKRSGTGNTGWVAIA